MSSAGDSGTTLLRVKAAGFDWALPVTAVVRVDRLEDAPFELGGDQARYRGAGEDADLDGLPLVTLEPWEQIGTFLAGRRLLRLQHEGGPVLLVVDEIVGQTTADAVVPLPVLPFSDPPPTTRVAVLGTTLIPLLDPAELDPSDRGSTVGASSGPGLDVSSDAASTAESDGEPQLMLLPAVGDGGASPLVPALSAAQVLAVEAHDDVLPMPGLPSWCPGLACRQGRPIPVFDLSSRLLGRPAATTARRRLAVAVPGGGVVGLLLDGACRPAPLPERALSIPASGPLAESVYALFQVESSRLAMLDLRRWCRLDP